MAVFYPSTTHSSLYSGIHALLPWAAHPATTRLFWRLWRKGQWRLWRLWLLNIEIRTLISSRPCKTLKHATHRYVRAFLSLNFFGMHHALWFASVHRKTESLHCTSEFPDTVHYQRERNVDFYSFVCNGCRGTLFGIFVMICRHFVITSCMILHWSQYSVHTRPFSLPHFPYFLLGFLPLGTSWIRRREKEAWAWHSPRWRHHLRTGKRTDEIAGGKMGRTTWRTYLWLL